MIAVCAIIIGMNSKNRKTLEAVFSEPTKTNIKWDDIVNLLLAVGARIIEGDGSKVRFVKDQMVFTAHRPHPGKETKPYQVRNARTFLKDIGVKL